MKTSFYSEEELKEIGIRDFGKNVRISRMARIYSPEKMIIGDNVRIDDFCIFTGEVQIGSFVHLAPFSGYFGGDVGIYIEDFVGISSRVSCYALSDDYSGEFMTNPMIPEKYKNTFSKKIHIKRHVLIGASSVILPGVTIGEGVSCGSFTLINKELIEWGIYAGVPAKRIKDRSKNLLELEKRFIEEYSKGVSNH